MLRSHEPGTVRAGFGSRSRFPRPREACPNGLRPRWQQVSSRHKLKERSSRRLCGLLPGSGPGVGESEGTTREKHARVRWQVRAARTGAADLERITARHRNRTFAAALRP